MSIAPGSGERVAAGRKCCRRTSANALPVASTIGRIRSLLLRRQILRRLLGPRGLLLLRLRGLLLLRLAVALLRGQEIDVGRLAGGQPYSAARTPFLAVL